MKYKLAKDIIDSSDIDALCSWLKTNQQLTTGPLTLKFEEEWCLSVFTYLINFTYL